MRHGCCAGRWPRRGLRRPRHSRRGSAERTHDGAGAEAGRGTPGRCPRSLRSGRMTAVMPEGVAIARDLVGPALGVSLDRLTPEVRAVAAYHLGMTDAAGRPSGSGGEALMACSCSIGAVYLGAPPALAMGLAAFGAHAGLAFQLTDDLLGIWGAPEITGKPVRSDLRTRKKSLPVVAALTSETDQGRQLGELLARPEPLTEEDLVLAAKLVEEADGRRWAEAEADTQLAEAERCLAETGMPDDVRAEFSAIAQFITTRQS